MDSAAGAHGTGEDNNVNAKILFALEGLQDCLGRLEVSRIKRDEVESMQGAIKTGIFCSALGRSFDASRMRMNAIYYTPPEAWTCLRMSGAATLWTTPLQRGNRGAR